LHEATAQRRQPAGSRIAEDERRDEKRAAASDSRDAAREEIDARRGESIPSIPRKSRKKAELETAFEFNSSDERGT
jgi:hypothetical protein